MNSSNSPDDSMRQFTDGETEAQRSRIIFLMATLLGQKSELGFELLSL